MLGEAVAALLALVSVSGQVAVEAQPTGKSSRVGFLTPIATPGAGQASPLLDALRDELRTLG